MQRFGFNLRLQSIIHCVNPLHKVDNDNQWYKGEKVTKWKRTSSDHARRSMRSPEVQWHDIQYTTPLRHHVSSRNVVWSWTRSMADKKNRVARHLLAATCPTGCSVAASADCCCPAWSCADDRPVPRRRNCRWLWRPRSRTLAAARGHWAAGSAAHWLVVASSRLPSRLASSCQPACPAICRVECSCDVAWTWSRADGDGREDGPTRSGCGRGRHGVKIIATIL